MCNSVFELSNFLDYVDRDFIDRDCSGAQVLLSDEDRGYDASITTAGQQEQQLGSAGH
jgi:hypothetical protein